MARQRAAETLLQTPVYAGSNPAPDSNMLFGVWRLDVTVWCVRFVEMSLG